MRLKHAGLFYLLCLLISGMFMLPQMRFYQPNFIDVVETWALGTAVVQNTLGEFSNQIRFWPALKFERSILNAVFSGHPQIYFFYFSVMLATTVAMIFFISYKKQRSIIFSIILFFFIYISPVTVDTYWRLGAAETLFTLFLVASIYTLINGRYVSALVLAVGLMATKESAVFYIPIYLGILLFQKHYKEGLILGVLYGGFLMKIYQLVQYALTHQAYTSMITTGVQSGLELMVHIVTFHAFYMIMLWITVLVFIYRMVVVKKRSNVKLLEFGYIFFFLTISGICTLLAFRNTFQPYYAFPWMMTVILWLMWELQNTSKNIAWGVMTILVFLFFVMRIPEQTMWQMEYWQNDYAGDSALIDVVLKNTSTRYTLMRDYRPEYPIGLAYLMGDRSRVAVTDTIFLIGKERSHPEATLLCAPTFFQQRYCKWGVIHHE